MCFRPSFTCLLRQVLWAGHGLQNFGTRRQVAFAAAGGHSSTHGAELQCAGDSKTGAAWELGDGRPWGASKIGSIGSWIDVQDTCWYMDWSDSIRTHTLNHPRKEHEWHMLKRSSIVQLGTLARGSKLSSTIAIILECSCGVCRKCFTPQIQSIGFPSMIGHSWQFWKCIGGWGSPNGRKKPDWP